MNTKKLSAILLALVLVISSIAFCGCDNSGSSTDSALLSGKYVSIDGAEIFTFNGKAFTWKELNDDEYSGNYQISGGKITFNYDDGDVEVYSFSQNETSIFLDNDEYKKQ